MKQKSLILFLLIFTLSACSKSDPILPGMRTPVFDTSSKSAMLGNISKNIVINGFNRIKNPEQQKKYKQNLNNEIFEELADGKKRKIFSGFPTDVKIDIPRTPLFYKNFVYAGLTTGELVKINPKTRNIEWVVDIYKSIDMLSVNSVLDIVAPLVIDEGRLFVGGVGRAFCQVNISNGDKKWCADISVVTPFLIAGDLAFVVGTDLNLYALDTKTGGIYWIVKVKKSTMPKIQLIDDKYILIVGNQKIDIITGVIDD